MFFHAHQKSGVHPDEKSHLSSTHFTSRLSINGMQKKSCVAATIIVLSVVKVLMRLEIYCIRVNHVLIRIVNIACLKKMYVSWDRPFHVLKNLVSNQEIILSTSIVANNVKTTQRVSLGGKSQVTKL